MLENLINIDTEIFLYLNSLHSPFFDTLMWWISKKETWYPLYLVVLFFIFRKEKWQGFIPFIIIILLITAADQTSVKVFKEGFERLRPTHNQQIADLIHTVNNYRGGRYGFVSSHAANTFAFAGFISLFFKQKWITISFVLWAAIVSYSRIYLGVHYPADIIGGTLLGLMLAFMFYYLYQFINKKAQQKWQTSKHT